MRESHFQGQLCGENAVKDSEKKFWSALRDGTFSNHRMKPTLLQTNTLAIFRALN